MYQWVFFFPFFLLFSLIFFSSLSVSLNQHTHTHFWVIASESENVFGKYCDIVVYRPGEVWMENMEDISCTATPLSWSFTLIKTFMMRAKPKDMIQIHLVERCSAPGQRGKKGPTAQGTYVIFILRCYWTTSLSSYVCMDAVTRLNTGMASINVYGSISNFKKRSIWMVNVVHCYTRNLLIFRWAVAESKCSARLFFWNVSDLSRSTFGRLDLEMHSFLLCSEFLTPPTPLHPQMVHFKTAVHNPNPVVLYWTQTSLVYIQFSVQQLVLFFTSLFCSLVCLKWWNAQYGISRCVTATCCSVDSCDITVKDREA